MQKIGLALASAFMAVFLTGAPVLADDDAAKAIGARKSQMHLYSWNLGQLGAMAKGEAAYDAATAGAAAVALAGIAGMPLAPLWPKGSDGAAHAGASRAKPEIWSDFADFETKAKVLADAASHLSSVAGNGLPALQGAMGEVGKACGACHKANRMPE